jgi:hypothetical protein
VIWERARVWLRRPWDSREPWRRPWLPVALVLRYASIVRDVDRSRLRFLLVVEPDDRDLAHVSQEDGVAYVRGEIEVPA